MLDSPPKTVFITAAKSPVKCIIPGKNHSLVETKKKIIYPSLVSQLLGKQSRGTGVWSQPGQKYDILSGRKQKPKPPKPESQRAAGVLHVTEPPHKHKAWVQTPIMSPLKLFTWDKMISHTKILMLFTFFKFSCNRWLCKRQETACVTLLGWCDLLTVVMRTFAGLQTRISGRQKHLQLGDF
jgi:hypothetical protein